MHEQIKVPVSAIRPTAAFRDFATQTGEPVGWLRTEIDRLFEDLSRPARSAFRFGDRSLAVMPALDLIDDDMNYRLSVELPGLTDKDIEISMAGPGAGRPR